MANFFFVKKGQTKTALAPKPTKFFEIVLIFDFMRDEVENFRKTVSGARSRYIADLICYLPTCLAHRGITIKRWFGHSVGNI